MYWGDGTDEEFDKHRQMMVSLRHYLVKIRQKVSTDLNQFLPLIEQLQCEQDRLRSTDNLRTISSFMSAVQSVSSTTTSLMTMFMSLMISKAVGVCAKAPCLFSVVGMGSLAKGETTPYSDIEFLFLIEKKTTESLKYFEKLAVTVYFIIGNLKETKLKYMSIAELKGWFDDKATNGFKIDGLSVNAGNIPTGNGSTQPRYRMIMTVDEAALWYERVLTMPNEEESVRGDESAMLSNTCHIHGEKRLHDEFKSGISSLFQNSARRAATKAMISNDMEKFEFLPDEKLVEIRNVKEDLFRFPSLIVFDLRQFHQIWVKDSWAVIEKLRRLSIISTEVWLSLKFLYSIGIYCRLAAYIRCGSQVEDFSVLLTTETYQLPKTVLIHLFIHLIPIKKALNDYIAMGNSEALQMTLPQDDNLALSLTHYYYGDYRQFNELIEKVCEGKPMRLGTQLRLMYAYSLIQCQRFDAAESIVNRTLDMEIVGLRDLVTCCMLLGQGYYEQGQHRKSLGILERADRHLKSQILNISNPTVAAIYGLMGLNYEALGDHDSALQYHERSLKIQLDIYGDTDHHDIATSYENMALVYRSQGDFGKALQYHKKSLNIGLNIYGHTDHPYIALSYNNMALVYQSQGDYNKALQYHDKSLNMQLNIYQHNNHPHIAALYNNMASIYRIQGDYSKALQYHEKSLNMLQNIHGHTDHPNIATSVNNMAMVYDLQGDYKKALQYYKRSLDMEFNLYGHIDHPQIAFAYNNMAMVYDSLGDYSKALQYNEKSLNMRLKIYGDIDHPDIACSYNNMAKICYSQRYYSKALQYHEKSLNMRINIHGHRGHPDITASYSSIASVYHSQGDYSKALQYHEKSLNMKLLMHQTVPHPDVVDSYRSMGDVSMSLSDFSLAVRYYHESLSYLQKLSCDAEKVKFLYIYERLVKAHYFNWY